MDASFYGQINGVKKPVSRIFLGTAMDVFFNNQAQDLLDSLYAQGINAFDTARNYGNSEKTLGHWIMDRGVREHVILLSKCGHPDENFNSRLTPAAIREEFDISSNQLGTDYIDIYILHRDDPEIPVEPLIEVMNELHQAGKIHTFGVSNWTHDRIEKANLYAVRQGLIPFNVSSPHFCLAEQHDDPWGGGCISLSGQANQSARDWYRKNQMPVIAYSSLGRGLFSGRFKGNHPENAAVAMDPYALKGYGYPDNFERLRRAERLAELKHVTVAQVALAYLFSQGLNVYAIIGTQQPERMQANIDAFGLRLTQEESAYLDLLTD